MYLAKWPRCNHKKWIFNKFNNHWSFYFCQVASMVVALIVSAFPMTTHAIHILHQSWVFDVMFSVFKPLLDVKMQNKIFFHGSNMESLHEHISPLHLPKKYGGTREELAYYKWIDNLSKVPQIVKEMKQVGYIVPEEIQKQLDQLVEDWIRMRLRDFCVASSILSSILD